MSRANKSLALTRSRIWTNQQTSFVIKPSNTFYPLYDEKGPKQSFNMPLTVTHNRQDASNQFVQMEK